MKNPNAAVGAGGSGLSVFVVWLATNVFHWSLSAEDGAVIAGAVVTVVLFVGRNGIKGLWKRLINGTSGQSGLTLIEALIVLVAVGVLLLLFGKTF